MIIRRVSQVPVTSKVQPRNDDITPTVSSTLKVINENKTNYLLKLLKGAFVAAVITFVSFLSPEVGAAVLALLITDTKRDD